MPDPKVSRDAIGALVRLGPLPGSLWRHAKGGLYTVVAAALAERDLAPVVVYRGADGVTGVRPLAEWVERFKPAEVPT